MSDLNICCFIGRLTRDSEIKYMTDGLQIVKFSLAVNRRAKVNGEYKDVASYLNFVYMGKAAEATSVYLVKGKQVAVESECRMDSYRDSNGQIRTSIEFLVHSLHLIGSSSNPNGNSGTAGGTVHNAVKQRQQEQERIQDQAMEDTPDLIENVPF